MRRLLAQAIAVLTFAAPALAAPPGRKPLDANQRSTVLGLMKAVDEAQAGEQSTQADGLQWQSAVLKSSNGSAYVPFRLALPSRPKSGTVYVRAVSHRNGVARVDEVSLLRAWLATGQGAPRLGYQTVMLPLGELPVGGPGASSGRQSVQQATASHVTLELQARAYEKDKVAAETARLVFPFEEYYFFSATSLERALALPAGEYDLYVAVVDRAVKNGAPSVLKQTITIPDFWDDRLALSTLLLVHDVRTLKAPLAPEQQIEHPYTFGQAEIEPVVSPTFTPDDALSVVYQMCNYGAPSASLAADYAFYRTDGPRRLFNRMDPQEFSDDDLPPSLPWSTQAFAMQSVSLKTFPPGAYELEVTVRDRLTRATATGRVAFIVAVR